MAKEIGASQKGGDCMWRTKWDNLRAEHNKTISAARLANKWKSK